MSEEPPKLENQTTPPPAPPRPPAPPTAWQRFMKVLGPVGVCSRWCIPMMSLFRPKTDEEARYFEVTPGQRGTMAALYFGLLVVLVLGMRMTHIEPGTL